MQENQKELIIVTGGDAAYFPLIKDQILSIRTLPQGGQVHIGVLDGGLLPQQKEYLVDNGALLVRPEWPGKRIREKAGKREFLLINLNKPSLDLLFPGYKTIIWLDGDTWLQNWSAVDMFCQVARKGKLGIVSKASRLRSTIMRVSPRIFGWVRPRGFLYNNARRARLPRAIIQSLVNKAVFNAGAYALSRNAPHWQSWRKWQARCLVHGRPFSSDQLSLALTIYEDGLPYEALPDICNYMGPWRINEDGDLVDYFVPHEPVSVVHMVGKATGRVLEGKTVAGEDLNDRAVNIHLGYRKSRK